MTSYVRTLYEFVGEPGTSEISINPGDILTVLRTDVGEGWWEGKNQAGQTGLFPAGYVEVMSATEVAQQFNGNGGGGGVGTADDDGEDWEDDWDDDNETYSEIGPASGGGNHIGGTTKNTGYGLSHSSSSYDNKNLPAAPADDTISLSSSHPGAGAATVKKSGMFAKSSDSYILGLSNKEKLADSDIVYVMQTDSFYHWQPNTQPYTVRVASPKKETKFKGMKSFIAYQLTPSFNNISVSRRYKHFDWLHERLVDKFCLIPIPPLPDKQISGRYEDQFVEHRRVQLQEFVDWVCRHPVLSKCEVWYHFLTCNDEKIWKSGKRRAERDTYVGVTYCWAIYAPEKTLLMSFVDAQMDSCANFSHLMDGAVKNLLAIASEQTKRHQIQMKKDFQRIGDGLSDLAKALNVDERRAPPSGHSLAESVGRVGGLFINIGQLCGDQPRLDWIPLSDRLHIYRGILNSFPDILSTHKGAVQKRKDCERLVADQKMGNQQLAEVNRRVDVISYAVMAEMTHFREERDKHLKETLKEFMEEQIKFYSNIVARLQEAHQQLFF